MGFTIDLEEAASRVSDEYEYTVEATAEGGATETFTSTMTIGEACSGTVDSTFDLEYSYDIPSSGSNTENFPSASTDYISLDELSADYFVDTVIIGCYQTFSYTI